MPHGNCTPLLATTVESVCPHCVLQDAFWRSRHVWGGADEEQRTVRLQETQGWGARGPGRLVPHHLTALTLKRVPHGDLRGTWTNAQTSPEMTPAGKGHRAAWNKPSLIPWHTCRAGCVLNWPLPRATLFRDVSQASRSGLEPGAAPGGRLRVLKHVLARGCGVTPGTAERATSLKPGHWSEVRCRCVAGQGSEIPEHTRQEEQAGDGRVAPVMQTTHCAGVEKPWPENQDVISKVKPKASAPLLCVELRAASLMW